MVWASVVDDVRPKPSCDHRSARRRGRSGRSCGSRGTRPAGRRSTPARRGRRRRSPAGARRREGAAGRERSAGRSRASPKRSSKKLGPKPTVIVRWPGVSPTASPVSIGGRSGVVLDRADRAARHHPRRGGGPGAEHRLDRVDVGRRGRSNAANASRSWAGVAMPAWCGSVQLDRVGRAPTRPPVESPVPAVSSLRGAAPHGRRPRQGGQAQDTPRDVGSS